MKKIIFSICTLILAVIGSAHAQNNGSREHAVINFYPEKTIKITSTYTDSDLKNIRFQNTGNKGIVIHLLGEDYHLGQNDYVNIDPPKTTKLHFKVRPWDRREAFRSRLSLLHHGSSRSYLMTVQPQTNDTTNKTQTHEIPQKP